CCVCGFCGCWWWVFGGFCCGLWFWVCGGGGWCFLLWGFFWGLCWCVVGVGLSLWWVGVSSVGCGLLV
ncbi:hypothetical protein RA279_28070, partial [Pseudomonas syringae pv. tagetis]|uniref:hypothetical protein n=1 Tax=Pseudomonas syringae group genomosp. 7 TaxID=251699 RepID=UPI00376F5827